MTTRGQLVIPKAIRDSWGIQNGDQLDLTFDGKTLRLTLHDEQSDLAGSGLMMMETTSSYTKEPPNRTQAARPQRTASMIWAERAKAIDGIRRLRSEFKGLDARTILAQSREELEERRGSTE